MSDQYRSDQYGGDQYHGDQRQSEQYGSGQYGSGQYSGEQYQGDQHRGEQYGSDQYRGEQYGGEQYQREQYGDEQYRGDRHRGADEGLAYGTDYSSSRGYYDQPGSQQGQDRGIIGDTFKKFKSKYDQYQTQNRPQQDFGYGANPSTSTVGSQQYGGSGYAAGSYNQTSQSQAQQAGQPAYPGGPPPPKPQQKPGAADKLLGGLLGSVVSIGSDVQKIVGGSHGHRPPQGQGQIAQPGLQSNLQTQVPSGSTRHRFDSTFPGPRPGNDVKWYVDGCGYMWAVSQALENARQTIWILDWWLSPELYLRRPPARNEEWRIDKVLLRAANRGVKVNIIVYKEVTQVLTLSSSHTKHALEALSPNISVFRHPDHLPDAQTAHSSIVSSLQGLKLGIAGASKLGADALKGIYGITDDVILYWAHHEKLCLIDGQIAFMGGLDLCYGRWDTNQHPIADAHPSDLNKIVFPGQDYNNARVMDFSEVNHPFQNKLDRTKSSRMGWSDISICLRGPCVGDLIHHFVDRWNFIYDEKYNVRKDKRYQRLPDYPDHRREEGPGPAPPTTAPQQGSTQAIGQSQGQQAGQFPPPPQGSGYTQPPWQDSSRPTNPSGGLVGLNTTASQPQSSQPGYGQQGQSQQGFPPPPPGQPPSTGQYDQSQSQGYPRPPPSPQPGQGSTQYGTGQPQSTYPPPPPGPAPGQSTSQYGSGTQQSTYPPPSVSPQPGYTQGSYGPGQQQSGYPPAQSPQPGQQSTYQQQPPYSQSSHGPGEQQAGYTAPASGQTGQYGSQQQQYQPPTGSQGPEGQYGVHSSQPTFSPPPQSTQPGQGQYQSRPSQDVSQRPLTPTGPPEAQIAAQQYAAYTGPASTTQTGAPGSQGPAELGSSQYRPYTGQPTARGLGQEQEYGTGYSGERGFGDDEYDDERGGERAFGRKPGASPSRFDRYKDEAMKFKSEGKILGHDVGKYGYMLESRLDDKLSHHTGGRYGRPQSSAGGMSCQLVRSCTKWSNGTNTEHSVQNAYIDLIQNSKHFIYIENQFFITATGDKQKPVKNLIGKALVERIVRASKERQPFKIIVNIPAVPAFAGDLMEDAALGTRAIMEFQYSSICRGGNSIMEEVAKAGVNPMDYIRFYNLRNYDRINVTPAMQQAQQQAGIGYDDARKQYESQLGSGYGGYGEIAAPTVAPGQLPPQQSYSAQQGQQPPYGSQYTQQAPYGGPQAPGQPYGGAPGQQQQYGGQQGQQAPYSGQPGQQGQSQQQYGSQQGQQQPYSGQSGQYGSTTRGPGQPGQQPPYGSQQGQYQSQPPPQQTGYGPQQVPQAYNQYQQAAHAAPHVKADDWDSVSSCYMLGGQDIRNVPWSGPPEAELDAFVSEELYIHSKVMIVDDQTVICGSANLNDRSMLGTHDSEIALVINDQTPVQSTMAGRPWQANRFAASLRRQLFRKHLGLIRPQDMELPDDNFKPVGAPNVYDWGSPEDNIVSDPLSDAFQSLWNSRARTNTEVFRKAFRAVPDDGVKTWPEYKEFYEYYFAKADAQAGGKDEKQKQSRVEYGHVVKSDFPGGVREVKELLSQVKGTLVEMPLCFLQAEDIAKEGVSFNAVTAEIYT